MAENEQDPDQQSVFERLGALGKIFICGINWKLYMSLFLLRILKVSFKTFKYRFLGELGDDDMVTINAQVQWVRVLREIVEESILIPLFACFGHTIVNRETTINKFRTGFVTSLAVFGPFTLLFIGVAKHLVDVMDQEERLRDVTVPYIQLELVVNMLQFLSNFCVTTLTVTNTWLTLAGLAIVKSGAHTIFAFIFWGPSVLKLGAMGIAYGNLAAESLVLLLVFIGTVYRLRMSARHFLYPWEWYWGWLRSWSRIGFFSGADSLVRNFTYLFLILRMVNQAKNGGQFWVLSGFVWNWLLTPFLPLMDVTKQAIATKWKSVDYKGRTRELLTAALAPYLMFMAGLVLVWIATIPAYDLYFSHVVRMPDSAEELKKKMLVLLPAYIAILPNKLMFAVLAATGATHYVFAPTLLVNVVVYGWTALYYIAGEFVPTFVGIAELLSSAMVSSAVVTFAMYAWYVSKHGTTTNKTCEREEEEGRLLKHPDLESATR